MRVLLRIAAALAVWAAVRLFLDMASYDEAAAACELLQDGPLKRALLTLNDLLIAAGVAAIVMARMLKLLGEKSPGLVGKED